MYKALNRRSVFTWQTHKNYVDSETLPDTVQSGCLVKHGSNHWGLFVLFYKRSSLPGCGTMFAMLIF